MKLSCLQHGIIKPMLVATTACYYYYNYYLYLKIKINFFIQIDLRKCILIKKNPNLKNSENCEYSNAQT